MAPSTKKFIKIIEINVNSIITNERRFNLLKFIEKNDPDEVFLNETKLNKKHKISFQNYQIIRRDRPDAIQGGGSAI